MNRRQLLFAGPSMGVTRYDHPAVPRHHDPREEASSGHAICFIERGGFTVHRGRRSWRLSPHNLFVTWPGMRYRCTHEGDLPDDVCLVIHLSRGLVEQVESASGQGWTRTSPVAPMSNRLAYLKGRLSRALDSDAAPLAVPGLGGELLAALADAEAPSPQYRPSQLAWYAERVEAARGIMDSRFTERHTLEALGREVGVSPFHFSRIFRELTGIPPHRYLMRVRLREAAARLADGASVTQACLEAGFNNLGHFIRLFRRTYGESPSHYQA